MREQVQIFVEEVNLKKTLPKDEAKEHAFGTYITSFLGGQRPSMVRHYTAKKNLLEWLHGQMASHDGTLDDATRLMVSTRHAVAFVNGVWKAWRQDNVEDVIDAKENNMGFAELSDIAGESDSLLKNTRYAYTAKIMSCYQQLHEALQALPAAMGGGGVSAPSGCFDSSRLYDVERVHGLLSSHVACNIREAVNTMQSEGLATYRNNFEAPFFDAVATFFQTKVYTSLTLHEKWGIFIKERHFAESTLHPTSVTPYLTIVFSNCFSPSDDVFSITGNLATLLRNNSKDIVLLYTGHKAKSSTWKTFLSNFSACAHQTLAPSEEGLTDSVFAAQARLLDIVARHLSNDPELRKEVALCMGKVLKHFETSTSGSTSWVIARALDSKIRTGKLAWNTITSEILRPVVSGGLDRESVVRAMCATFVVRSLEGFSANNLAVERRFVEEVVKVLGRGYARPLVCLLEDLEVSTSIFTEAKLVCNRRAAEAIGEPSQASKSPRGILVDGTSETGSAFPTSPSPHDQLVSLSSFMCFSMYATTGVYGWTCGSLPPVLRPTAAIVEQTFHRSAGARKVLFWVPMNSSVVVDWHHATGTTTAMMSAKHLHALLFVLTCEKAKTACTSQMVASHIGVDEKLAHRIIQDLQKACIMRTAPSIPSTPSEVGSISCHCEVLDQPPATVQSTANNNDGSSSPIVVDVLGKSVLKKRSSAAPPTAMSAVHRRAILESNIVRIVKKADDGTIPLKDLEAALATSISATAHVQQLGFTTKDIRLAVSRLEQRDFLSLSSSGVVKYVV